MMKTKPAVFAVNDHYQIIVPVDSDSLFYVQVGDRKFFDHSNGIMRSGCDIHKVNIPMELLNSEKQYTVCERKIINRSAYKTESEELISETFDFRPVPEDNIRIYNISDAHDKVIEPIIAAKTFGEIDLLILNGDIMHICDDISCYMNVYKICSEITGGNIPIVSARGNHDMRGKVAEKYGEYMPSANGDIFYTFKLGSLWGVVLDCGEITDDSDLAYGYTVCCNPFREAQTEFLKNVVTNKEKEYAAEGIKNRIVVVHDPFFERHTPPYDVTRDIFKEWFDIINPNIKPDLWLCGHAHRCEVRRPPYSVDEFGIKAPHLIASTYSDNYFKGGAIEIKGKDFFVTFTDSNGEVFEKIKL